MPDRSDNRGNRTSRSNQGLGQISDRKRKRAGSKSDRSSHGGDHSGR